MMREAGTGDRQFEGFRCQECGSTEIIDGEGAGEVVCTVCGSTDIDLDEEGS